jgi:hypothetical protein
LCQRIDPEKDGILLGFGQLDGLWHGCTVGEWDRATLIAVSTYLWAANWSIG